MIFEAEIFFVIALYAPILNGKPVHKSGIDNPGVSADFLPQLLPRDPMVDNCIQSGISVCVHDDDLADYPAANPIPALSLVPMKSTCTAVSAITAAKISTILDEVK